MSVVTIDEIENLPNRPEALLIDVRDPPEIKSTGLIPTSINIPRKYNNNNNNNNIPCKLIGFMLMNTSHLITIIGKHLIFAGENKYLFMYVSVCVCIRVCVCENFLF